MEKLSIRSHDGLELSTLVFEARQTKALVQIIHGAKEHKERYFDFIHYLNDHGFTVIISDNRGHGASINDEFPLGYMDGYEQIILDQLILTKYIKTRFPNKELYLIGHSLGSVFARCYLKHHDDEIDKLVLSGTVNHVPGTCAGILLGKTITAIFGKHGYNAFLEQLSFKNLKDDSWISSSTYNLDKYRRDPLCQYAYQNNAVMTMLRGVKQLHDVRSYRCTNPYLPILSVSGEGDPITGGEKGLKDSIRSLKKIGYVNVEKIVYPGMKHEVLNEDDKEKVYQDIVEFLNL